ncbi:CpaF/VirB11 family protein, partial [Xanthobacter autotrophicus]|nr:CpaF/VirB11 family protein [Xanthobacter autotrophicus]
RDLLKIAIDVIVQCKRIGGRFRVTEVYFDPHRHHGEDE